MTESVWYKLQREQINKQYSSTQKVDPKLAKPLLTRNCSRKLMIKGEDNIFNGGAYNFQDGGSH